MFVAYFGMIQYQSLSDFTFHLLSVNTKYE